MEKEEGVIKGRLPPLPLPPLVTAAKTAAREARKRGEKTFRNFRGRIIFPRPPPLPPPILFSAKNVLAGLSENGTAREQEAFFSL